MRTTHDPLTPAGGGAPPPVVPIDLPVDEGPMRSELLRQIRRLEIEMSRFAAANCPFDGAPRSARRGPAILTTAQLEEIRDELLEARAALHQLVVDRSTARLRAAAAHGDDDAPKKRRGLLRRRED